LQGLLLQVDVAEIVMHEAYDPDAVVDFLDACLDRTLRTRGMVFRASARAPRWSHPGCAQSRAAPPLAPRPTDATVDKPVDVDEHFDHLIGGSEVLLGRLPLSSCIGSLFARHGRHLAYFRKLAERSLLGAEQHPWPEQRDAKHTRPYPARVAAINRRDMRRMTKSTEHLA
jgi:hypothetical protein